jgi:hypothetical protein
MTGDLLGLGRLVTAPDARPAQEASGSVNRVFRLLCPGDPPTAIHPTGFMIADAVRYMSVHS